MKNIFLIIWVMAFAIPVFAEEDVPGMVAEKKITLATEKKESRDTLEARIAVLEKKIKGQDAKIKKAVGKVVESKGKVLEDRINNKIVEFDNKQANEAEANKKAKAEEKAELKIWKKSREVEINKAVKTADAAMAMTSSIWLAMSIVILGIVVLYVIVIIIGVTVHKRK